MPSNPLASLYQHALNNPTMYGATVAAVATSTTQFSLARLSSYFDRTSHREQISRAYQKITETILAGNTALQKKQPDFGQGIKYFEKALNLLEEFTKVIAADMTMEMTSEVNEKRISILYAIAHTYFTIGEYEKALGFANQILEKTTSRDTLNLRGMIQLRKGLFDSTDQAFTKAAADFSASLQLDPTQNDILAFKIFINTKQREEKMDQQTIIDNYTLITKYIESYVIREDNNTNYMSAWVAELTLVGALTYENLNQFEIARILIMESIKNTMFLNSTILEIAALKDCQHRILHKYSFALTDTSNEFKEAITERRLAISNEANSVKDDANLLRRSKNSTDFKPDNNFALEQKTEVEPKKEIKQDSENKQKTVSTLNHRWISPYLGYKAAAVAVLGVTAYFCKDSLSAGRAALFFPSFSKSIPSTAMTTVSLLKNGFNK